MKKTWIAIAIAVSATALYAFISPKGATAQQANIEDVAIKWYTWDEAIAANAKKPKKIFIDLYTEWCGYCKKMDANTFKDPAVVKYMNEHFYAVKFDAEQKGDITYNDHTFKYHGNVGRNGIHELAYSLLDGRMSYPSFVYMDEKIERISISPGYKEPAMLLNELRFTAEDHYKTKTWQDYQSTAKQ